MHLLELSPLLSCENLEEAETYLQDKWADNASMEGYKEIYQEMKEVVKQRVDWDPTQVDAILKTLP